MEKVYLGKYSNEELYINLKDKNLTGWSLMGLRPETEANLRERAKETDITDFYSIPKELERYIDHDQFSEDMENDWLERHDSQGEYNIDKTTYYLGFGSGTHLLNFMKEHKIKTSMDWFATIEESPLTMNQANTLIKIIEEYGDFQFKETKKDQKNKEKWYAKFLKLANELNEYPQFTDEYKAKEVKK